LSAPTISSDDAEPGERGKSLRVAWYIFVWYFLNAVFAIINKRTLGVFPHFWLLSWTQIGVGAAFMLVMWRFRLIEPPGTKTHERENGFEWNWNTFKALAPTSALHLVAHCTACASYSLGSVSFFMLVKAAEPACSVFLTSIFFKRRYSKLVWLTMIPIVGGVAVGSTNELNFSLASFICAMLSNVASALRSATSKDVQITTGLSGVNLYGAMSVVGAALLLPVSLLMEGGKIYPAYVVAKEQMVAKNVSLFPDGFLGEPLRSFLQPTPFLLYLLVGGLLFHLYNQTSYQALGELQPLDISVANAVKRVVIIMASVAVLKNPITPLGGASAAVAIAGTFLYSLASQKQSADEAAEAKRKKKTE
jgi:solute carrier family 35 protein E1